DLTGHADSLLLDGDGTLLRVSSDPLAKFTRTNVTTSHAPKMKIGAGARITGGSLTLDSTYATDLSPRAYLRGRAVNLSSGQISLRLDHPGDLLPTDGLVLAGRALRSLRNADSLSLLSYSSIDIYGTGRLGSRGLDNLELHAGEIRGFHTGDGTAAFMADHVLLDNSAGATAPGPAAASSGTLAIRANTLELGDRRLRIDQFAKVNLNASGGILLGGKGRLLVDGALDVRTPAFFAIGGATETIRATGELQILDSRTPASPDLASGLGASLTLEGSDVTANADILLPSGLLALHATTGDVNVNGRLDVGGTAQRFNDLVHYTSGGAISLLSDAGSVNVGRRAALNVSAQKGGGDAGSIDISAARGAATLAGALSGKGGAKGRNGSFSLDAAASPDFARLAAALNDASFDESRNFRVRQGDVRVAGVSIVRNFRLSADRGSILVTGGIDASGDTGGTISLTASGSVVLADGASLDASGRDFSEAGKGGAVTIEAGSQVNGVIDSTALLDIRSGSSIDLSVASAKPDSADFGKFTGTLHLRAPQTVAGTDVRVAALGGVIKSASSILVEGYKLFDLTATNGNLSGSTLTALRNNVMANGNLFVGAAGTTTAAYTAMLARLLAANPALESVLSIRPGAEIIHRTGSITLGTATTTNANDDWNFSTFRFGPKRAPGVLTLRAAGNLVFNNALHDGFVIRTPTPSSPLTTAEIYQAPLMDANPLLPLNAQSWSYRLVAGADFSATDFRKVRPLASLGTDLGSLMLGRNIPRITIGGAGIQTRNLIANRYQVIRTGSGDIDIYAGRDVRLLNLFASIYSAGTKVNDPSLGGRFDLPVTFPEDQGNETSGLGSAQQNPGYVAQYTLGGGDVTIHAQHDITHLTRLTSNGPMVEDSQKELPNNWLYRRGFVDPTTGRFGATPQRLPLSGGVDLVGGDVTSTSWWVDFSNFFEGVGALGGGNVSLTAGNDVSNVDAVIPTNARLPKTATSADQLVELGGGDLLVRAGHDINAGVYYVERGRGSLAAGNDIRTNATRAPSAAAFRNLQASEVPGPEAWLPTTLFLGKGGFNVSARGDVLLGPTANVFLLPEGVNNSIWYKTYFSTYAPTSEVDVSSLGGSVTIRARAALPGQGGNTTPMLQAWLQTQQLLVTTSGVTSASFFLPWLRLNEQNVNAFPTAVSLLPPTLRATAFSGDLNLVGAFNLSPAARGTAEFAAAGAINGLQPAGEIQAGPAAPRLVAWSTSRINLSDAAPSAIPGVLNPFAYRAFIGPAADRAGTARQTQAGYLLFLDRLFAETGALDSVLQTKQELHGASLLHAGDPQPLRLYALAGDISGLTLFSPKAAHIVAGQDITDNTFYIQNLDPNDISVVAAGRNLIAYNAGSPLRTLSTAPGNQQPGTTVVPQGPLAGDIQVAGPGTVAVLAGRNLDLGTGPNNPDGTGTGITTVGNARNTNLPFGGANIVAAAGIGPATSLAGSALDFAGFIDGFLSGGKGAKILAEIDPTLTPSAFASLSEEQRDRIAVEAFYLLLRDAGRAQTAGTGSIDTGFAAIEALFPGAKTPGGAPARGDIAARSRDIRTKNGGSISLLVPNGELTLATSTIGNPLVPPGVITETGGNVSIFAHKDVDIGIGRIFTLRGGNIIIWSSTGDIAAGAAAKTVKSAPPTRVLIDPQSADVQTDLAGLSTGGGIGVLATVAGVPPGDVDLIAPVGVVDAGDAGIRVSGNLNIAATKVLNASNITVAGKSTGVPTAPVVAAPNIAGLTSASNTAGAANQAAENVARQARQQPSPDETPSDITVEVLGYGGDDQASL
ncbi:MAG: filamentous hemagglutinin family protein, partial [Terrimicrobiaceae bacterium]|nr:filamentous hemagglutinin family protein [Terrimicrobiaceae bacterium]